MKFMSREDNKADLKRFFIKLVAITFSIIVIINVTYNLLFADKLDSINKILTLNDKAGIEKIKDKIRLEIRKGIKKEKILSEEDKILLNKLYLKLKDEFREVK